VKRAGCLCKSCENYAMGNKPFKKLIPKLRKLIEKPKVI
jgi:hypothetical protein